MKGMSWHDFWLHEAGAAATYIWLCVIFIVLIAAMSGPRRKS